MAKNLGHLFIDAEDGIVDVTGNHTISNSGVITTTTEKKYGNYSVDLQIGTNFYPNDGAAAYLTLDLEPFTIDFWLKWGGGNSGSDNNKLIVKDQIDGNGWGLNATNGINMRFRSGSFSLLTTTDITDSEWHHIAFVRENINTDGFKVYVDGVLDGTETLSKNLNKSGDTAQMGMRWGAGSYLDNFRLTKGTALWTDEFNLTDATLFYTNEVNPYVRPDNITGLYSIVSSRKGNLRGKAAEGWVRPTIKQFFTSADFSEVASVILPSSYTSDLCSGGTATMDSLFLSYHPANAFDNNISTICSSERNPVGDPWLKYDFHSGNAKRIEKYTLRCTTWTAIAVGTMPKDFLFQGSNNNSDWTTLDSQTGQIFIHGEQKDYTFQNENYYRYYRLIMSANNYSSGFLQIGEMEMMEGIYE